MHLYPTLEKEVIASKQRYFTKKKNRYQYQGKFKYLITSNFVSRLFYFFLHWV